MKEKKTNRRWTTYDDDYVRQNLGRESFRSMADYLGRSEMSVRLYVLRKKYPPLGVPLVRRNLFIALLKMRFKNLEDFTPSRAFYRETGIGQRRFGDLYYGRKAITGEEYKKVADYFGITVREVMESRQMLLPFEEE